MEVSIVLAVYNGEKYLKEQLESLKAQTYTVNEVLVADDKSSDRSIEIINNFIISNGLENIWRVAINQSNKGYSKNFLEAALSAKGNIIFFCDQDDIWEEDKVESMMKVFQINENIQLLASNLTPFCCDKDARNWEPHLLKSMKHDGSIEYVNLDKNTFHLRRPGCVMAIRKNYLHDIFKYWVEGWAHDDFVWKLSVYENKCAIYHNSTIKRRMHSNNTTNIKVRNRNWRIDKINQSYKEQYSFLDFALSIDVQDKNNKVKIIKRNIKALKIRMKMLKGGNVFLWILLFIKYRDCYPRKQGLYLDLYLVLFNSYKGNS